MGLFSNLKKRKNVAPDSLADGSLADGSLADSNSLADSENPGEKKNPVEDADPANRHTATTQDAQKTKKHHPVFATTTE
jgi:hypothetical protein